MVLVHDEAFFRRAVFGGDVGMGDSFVAGEWSSPDLVDVIRVAAANIEVLTGRNRWLSSLTRTANLVSHKLRANSEQGSRENIEFHYDLGNEFYELFLDPTMAYSCAYFRDPGDTLEQAQIQKFDLICRKLELSPEDHLLEIGTGWGGFALYAASHFGCRVTTTTISRQQHDYVASILARRPEIGERIELRLQDYRKLEGRYSKLVSIEMFEAVGYEHWDTFFRCCAEHLSANGLMLLQTITMNERRFPEYRKDCDFIQRRVFPGSLLASVSEVLKSVARVSRMQLAGMEEIGSHYSLTLHAWREAFLKELTKVRKLGFDEDFIRLWDYYLAYCEAGFAERYVGDVQLLFQNAPARHQATPSAQLALSHATGPDL